MHSYFPFVECHRKPIFPKDVERRVFFFSFNPARSTSKIHFCFKRKMFRIKDQCDDIRINVRPVAPFVFAPKEVKETNKIEGKAMIRNWYCTCSKRSQRNKHNRRIGNDRDLIQKKHTHTHTKKTNNNNKKQNKKTTKKKKKKKKKKKVREKSRPQEAEETDKSKQAQTEQTYVKH